MKHTNIMEDKRLERLIYQKEYNAKNKEKVADYQKLYYQRRKAELREKQKVKQMNMTDDEKQKLLIRNQKYAERWRSKMTDEERERRRELQRIYRENNKEKIESYRQKAAMNKKTSKKPFNMEKLNDPNYYQCNCGKTVHKCNAKRHEKTKTHMKLLCEIINDPQSDEKC